MFSEGEIVERVLREGESVKRWSGKGYRGGLTLSWNDRESQGERGLREEQIVESVERGRGRGKRYGEGERGG